jgi:hypothetical protein
VSEFWTEADSAELDVLLHALVNGYFEHRERCRICLSGERPCPHLQAAIREVVEWREARLLLSRAEGLRAMRRQFNEEGGGREDDSMSALARQENAS